MVSPFQIQLLNHVVGNHDEMTRKFIGLRLVNVENCNKVKLNLDGKIADFASAKTLRLYWVFVFTKLKALFPDKGLFLEKIIPVLAQNFNKNAKLRAQEVSIACLVAPKEARNFVSAFDDAFGEANETNWANFWKATLPEVRTALDADFRYFCY